jgi:hypothetical protein
MALRFAASFMVRVYGKNVMDTKLHPVLPVYKETSLIITKWKMPICMVNAVYKMQMIEAGGKPAGFVDDWPTLKSYLTELDYLGKAPTGNGWILFGQQYPTLSACRTALYDSPDFLAQAQAEIIKEVLASGAQAPDQDAPVEESL